MTLVRPHREESAANTVAVQASARPMRRAPRKGFVISGVLALLGVASSAPGLILTGGPEYILPGGGSCTVSGVTSQSGGALVTCSGVNLGAHTKVYFGIRNDSNVNGNTMTGTAPAASTSAVFRFASDTGSSITYTSSTTIADIINGNQAVSNRLILTLTSGSASVVAAGGNPTNSGNGDIERLFHITGGSDFQVRVDVQASNPIFPAFGNACPAVFDPTHAAVATRDISKVDLAFYFSDCGDGVVDSPEQCDLGGLNGSPSSCCTADCQFRGSGEVCRPGFGPPCDASETCTGLSGLCPPDDAPINLGVVCRPGSGDICDQNESCTGVPGAGCPPDDAPGKSGLICRLSTTGDICDENEVCTGVPGAPCPPDDAPSKLNVLCRAGSGDICDPDERCTGVPGQACPPDIVANPATVCRVGSGDMCDPNETCTAIPGQPCPADVVTPAGTVCRPAAGTCDVAEQCTGIALQACPANGFVAAQTPCDLDASVCTIDKCDGSGNCTFASNLDCDDGNACTQDSCDPNDGCEYSGAPSMSCAPASRALFKYKDSSDDPKDNLKFLWKGGPALVLDMGDPTQSTRYELCVYDNRGVQLAMGVPPGGPWQTLGSPSSPKGYKYIDSSAQNDGIKVIKTKGSNLPDKAKVKVSGKGAQLPQTADIPFVFPVTAQLYAGDGMCWEAEFAQSDTKKNESGAFTAKKQ
jgi:hypothetical protein